MWQRRLSAQALPQRGRPRHPRLCCRMVYYPRPSYFTVSFSSASALICSFSNSMRPAILPSSKLACCWSWICFCSSAVISSCLVMDSSRLDNDVDEILARDRYLEERAGRKTAGRGGGVRGVRRKGHDL